MDKQKVGLMELAVGDDVEIIIRSKVQQVDLDDLSIKLELANGSFSWLYPEEYADVEIWAKERPLIPADAEVVSVEIGLFRRKLFITKSSNGSWTDSDGEGYASTASLIDEIYDWNAENTLKVYGEVA